MIIQSNFVPNGLELRNVITVSVFFGIAADRRIGQKRNQLSNCTTRNCIIIIIIILTNTSYLGGTIDWSTCLLTVGVNKSIGHGKISTGRKRACRRLGEHF